MTGPEIMRFVKRNAYRPDLVAAHWHRVAGRLHDFAICVASSDLGYAYKVQIGDVPQKTINDPSTGKILVRGWEGLFKQMFLDGVIKDSRDLRDALGHITVTELISV